MACVGRFRGRFVQRIMAARAENGGATRRKHNNGGRGTGSGRLHSQPHPTPPPSPSFSPSLACRAPPAPTHPFHIHFPQCPPVQWPIQGRPADHRQCCQPTTANVASTNITQRRRLCSVLRLPASRTAAMLECARHERHDTREHQRHLRPSSRRHWLCTCARRHVERSRGGHGEVTDRS